MRPEMAEGESDFLGAKFEIARWPLAEQSPYVEPPLEVKVRQVAGIAPQYPGKTALPAVARELQGLSKMVGFKMFEPSVSGLCCQETKRASCISPGTDRSRSNQENLSSN
jgi:hypothetical protein